MTRMVMFRLILAMRMLPNFAAYWWILPRRMKHVRTMHGSRTRDYQRRFFKAQVRDWERSVPFGIFAPPGDENNWARKRFLEGR